MRVEEGRVRGITLIDRRDGLPTFVDTRCRWRTSGPSPGGDSQEIWTVRMRWKLERRSSGRSESRVPPKK